MEAKNAMKSMKVLRSAVLDGRMALYGREFSGAPAIDGKFMEFDLGDSEECPREVALLVAMASKGDLLHLLFEDGALRGAKLCVTEDGAVVAEISRGASMPGAVAAPPLPSIDPMPAPAPALGLGLPGLDAASLAGKSDGDPKGIPSMDDWASAAQIASKAVVAISKSGRFSAGSALEADPAAKAAIEAFGPDLCEASIMVVGVASDMLRRQVAGAG